MLSNLPLISPIFDPQKLFLFDFDAEIKSAEINSVNSVAESQKFIPAEITRYTVDQFVFWHTFFLNLVALFRCVFPLLASCASLWVVWSSRSGVGCPRCPHKRTAWLPVQYLCIFPWHFCDSWLSDRVWRKRTYNDKAYTSPHLFGKFFNFRNFI